MDSLAEIKGKLPSFRHLESQGNKYVCMRKEETV